MVRLRLELGQGALLLGQFQSMTEGLSVQGLLISNESNWHAE